MLWLCDAVRDFAGSAWLWPKILKLQFNPKSVEIEPTAAQTVVDRHYYFLRHGLYATFAAQGRWINSLRSDPALINSRMVEVLVIETEGDDVLLDKDAAHRELFRVFSGHIQLRWSHGIHANLVECPGNLQMLMQSWLTEQFSEAPNAS